ncbi:hypothetical protein FB45DRAFT_738910 [Roridomyces roridus]|uniref:Uncharacterized protein n=1 Tax=Roridomyces roridus TaxID=1738132 RepID=A0AAD7C8N5_9AGAR|nr:hypothetical protein FB45DRAFT_738910 [Roridomyces roridus]
MRCYWRLLVCTTLLTGPAVASPLDARESPSIQEIPLPALTLPAQQPNFNGFDLTSALPPASILSAVPVPLPASCSGYLGAPGTNSECLTTTGMSALSIQFEDCGTPFVVCRCADAQMSMDVALDRFSRVPVGLRRYASTIAVMATQTEANAFLKCTYAFQLTHAYDFSGTTSYASATSAWLDALSTDSCVPDAYSQTNAVEDFAQTGVLNVYMLIFGGNLPPGFQTACMSNQLAYVNSLPLFNTETLFGNTCDIVNSGPPARFAHYPGYKATHRQQLVASLSSFSPFRSYCPGLGTPMAGSIFSTFLLHLSILGISSVLAHLDHRTAVTESSSLGPQLTLQPQAPSFAFDLTNALPPASSSLTPLSSLPPACSDSVGPTNECTATMSATAITYEDCGDPFVVCRCADANMTMDTIVDRLGRVPVGLRRFVANVVVSSAPLSGSHAYTNLTTGDIHMFGDTTMDVWIHEVPPFDTTPSASQGWAEALQQDTCVPDNYSQTNRVEDFAQLSVIKIYALLHSGNLPPGFNSTCMQNQLTFMDGLSLYNATQLFGNTCAIRGKAGRSARHTKPPAVLDASRVFQTVPLDPTATAGAALMRSSGVSTTITAGGWLVATCVFILFWA